MRCKLHAIAIATPIAMAHPHLKSRCTPRSLEGVPPPAPGATPAALLPALLDAQKIASLGALAGNLAHDFNNLLTVVLGRAELTLLDEHDETTLRNLNEILEASTRAMALCRQVLGYAGLQAAPRRAWSLTSLVEHHQLLVQLVLSRRIGLTFEPGPDVPPVDFDEAAMPELLVNLANNAVEAIAADSGAVVIGTRVIPAPGADWAGGPLPGSHAVELFFRDSGTGPGEEVAARAFEPFFTTRPGHAGLGLTTVLAIVRAHGGAARLEAVPGGGGVARLAFPLLPEHPPSQTLFV